MENNKIEEDWYSMDDKHVIGYLKKITEQHDILLDKVDKLANKVDGLESMVKTYIQDQDKVELKKINQALHELKIIKEREINIMLREHIPFPFQHPSPSFKVQFRPPFSKK